MHGITFISVQHLYLAEVKSSKKEASEKASKEISKTDLIKGAKN